MKDKIKILVAFLFACCAFIFIDDVYAVQISYSGSSCSQNNLSYWNGVYYVELTCNTPTTITIGFDSPYAAGDGSLTSSPRLTLVQSLSVIDGNVKPSSSVLRDGFTEVSHFAYKSVCDVDPGANWCAWYPNMKGNTNSFTIYRNNYVAFSWPRSSSFDVSGNVRLAYVISHEVGDGSNILLSYNSYSSTITNNKLDGINSAIGDTNNKLDNVNSAIGDTNNKLNETNDYIKDDTAPSSDISVLGNVQGIFPPGPVDSLLNIPFQFLSVLTSSFGGVCVPMSGTFVFDSTLTLPCFSEVFYSNVPAALMVFINTIPSAFILIKYFKHLYKKVDRAVNMNANADDEWGVL